MMANSADRKLGRRPKSGIPKASAISMALALPSMFYWTWAILSLFGPLFNDAFAMDSLCYCIFFATFMVFTGICTVVSNKTKRIALSFHSSMHTELRVVFMGSIGNCAVLLTSITGFLWLAIVAGLILGIANGCYVLAWCRMYAREGSRSCYLMLCVAIAVSCILSGVISLLPPIACAVVTILIPEMNMVALFTTRSMMGHGGISEGDSNEGETIGAVGASTLFTKPQPNDFGRKSERSVYESGHKLFLDIPSALASSILLAGIAMGFMSIMAVFHMGTLFGNNPYLTLVIAGCALLIFWLLLYYIPKRAYLMLTALALLGALGFFWIAGFPYAIMVGYGLIVFGLIGLMINAWSMITELAYSTGKDVMLGMSGAVSVATFGALLGAVANVLLEYAHLPEDFAVMAIAIIGFIYVVAMFSLFVANPKLWSLVLQNAFAIAPFWQNEQSAQGEASESMSIEAIGEEHDLTARECEVLKLLLEGRSRPRIAKQLVVSENTISSHVQHIYRKFDVHGYQELLDRIQDLKG